MEPQPNLSNGLMQLARRVKRTRLSLYAATLVVVGMAVLAPGGAAQVALVVASAALVTMCLALTLAWRRDALVDRVQTDAAMNFIAQDSTPCFVTNIDGEITCSNKAARQRCEGRMSDTIGDTLRTIFANPTPILTRLKTAVAEEGSAREDVVTRRGQMRLSAHRMDDQRLLWKLEDVAENTTAARSTGPQLPMLMLGRGDSVLFMNDVARQLVGQRIKSLDRLSTEKPHRSGQIVTISGAEGPVKCMATFQDAGAGRRALFLLPAPEEGIQVDGGWQAFEDLPVPLVRTTGDGEVNAFNASAYQLLGEKLVKGAILPDLMEGLGRSISDWLKETLKGKVGTNSEFLRLKRRDKEVFVQVTLNRVSNGEGDELIAVLNDATELKTLEAQFVQSQKMQAIGQLAGGVAHDFNNLLTAISGHCDLLLLRHDPADHDYADLVQINQNANRAAALVGQLLAFSRKQTLRPETLDMRETLADLAHLLNRLVGEKVTLVTKHDPVLPRIRADKRQLEQVLMNLVVNARDAMPEGGEIRVTTEFRQLQNPLTRDNATVPSGDYVCVRVEDEGTGIPADTLQKVFEPFYTTKRTDEGTGLGLSTAYGIVKQTGGFIFVDSVVGQGTCFILYLPAQDESPAEAAASVAPVAEAASPKHGEGVVLLVEDEAPVRAFASRALRLRGYTVLEADCAEAALETLEDAELSVDVFVTDVVMPGMDGPSWVKEALKSRPDTRVVFVSGYAEDSFGETQTRIPNSVFLPKPFSLNDLTEMVHRQLH